MDKFDNKNWCYLWNGWPPSAVFPTSTCTTSLDAVFYVCGPCDWSISVMSYVQYLSVILTMLSFLNNDSSSPGPVLW